MALSRRTFIKLAGAGAASLSLGSVLAACSNESTSEGATEEASVHDSSVVVTMTPASEPAAGFNPLVAWGCGEHVHEPLIQSTLITTNTDLEFVNDLATGYECAPDGMMWTFTLRDDAYFTDGTQLTAADVAFTINGIINGAAAQADLSMVSEAVAADDFTVVLNMNRPNNALLYTLAVVGIVPEHAYDENYGANPIGSGRYMLEQWDQGQQVILRANPDYYGAAPTIERLIVLFMEEDASQAAAQAGQVDVAYTSAVLAENVPAEYDLLNCASVDSRGISLPCVPAGGTKVVDGDMAYAQGNDVTCDVALRRALNCGIDRDRMIEEVLNGYGTVAYSVSDGAPWASPDMAVETDVERARALLAEGGWAAGDDGVMTKDGVRAVFDLYYAAGDSVRQALAANFASQAAELGIQVMIKGASWDDIYARQYADTVLWGWGSNSPVELFELTHSQGWGNFASYENAAVDAHLEAAQAQANIEDSYVHYQLAQWDAEAQEGVAPQGAATWVWLANIDHLYFCRSGLNVAKQKPHPHGHGWSLVNNVDTWSWASE